ncbi:MAG: M3 family metallopeptidase [Myxococcales bacterium]|nr:M3 family metallopeptidase [Myxococcales bacterium]
MQNPLLEIRFEVPFDRISPSHVVPAISTLIEEAEQRIDAIGDEAPTYENTLGELERATETLEWAMTVVGHLESVATTAELREAYNTVQPLVSAFYSGIALKPKLYEALRRFAETDEARSLSPTKARFLEKTLRDFKRHGAELSEEGKARLREIDVALAEKTTKFAQNVLDATQAFELYVEDEARLSGLPESAKQAARASAREKSKEGYRFTLQAPSVIPVLTYADDAALRETIYRAFNSRAASGPYDNRTLVREILALRQKKAELLGYADFSDLVLEDRMAKTGEAAMRFVDDLRARTLPAFAAENAALEAFRKELEGEDAPPFKPWDLSYYAEKQRRARFDFDEEALRPYFPADRVLEGLFTIVQELYRVEIRPHSMPVWDPKVETFGIYDRDGSMLAAFYVDLYPRENKRDGAWMNPILTGLDGRPHLGLFCGNMSPPIDGKPALLTHNEVETLFHEFGHLLHHAFSRVEVRSLAGTNVAWDFVELPSQIMENWCWEREALDRFARHHATGEPIPDELFERLRATRTYRAANAQMRQLGFATLDLMLHREWVKNPTKDLLAYAREIAALHSPAVLEPDYAMITSFGHLFASPTGYAAGYYSYKWAEVLDADAFSRFAKEGVLNPEVGKAFRESILEKGDSADPAELYRAFMGRDPKLEPLLERSGLLAA